MSLSIIIKNRIEKKTGLSVDSIYDMNVDEIDSRIEKKNSFVIKYPDFNDERIPGRGTPLLTNWRVTNPKETEEEMNRRYGRE